MNNIEEQYNELSFYTLAHQDIAFIHQHIVDAQTAQIADKNTKSISLIFSLVGLYLYIEKKFTGKQVQQFHIKMAKNKCQWPQIIFPEIRGNINVSDVLAVSPGPKRDKMIQRWCISVWEAYSENRISIINLIEKFNH